jgi:hypothetical protein
VKKRPCLNGTNYPINSFSTMVPYGGDAFLLCREYVESRKDKLRREQELSPTQRSVCHLTGMFCASPNLATKTTWQHLLMNSVPLQGFGRPATRGEWKDEMKGPFSRPL